ncbi:single-stranded-DNA-specific exonuclease RecJ [Candidatus Falkowbacteria bacterium CG10_big_fil_rev_8_21_14_0_10_39_9]|uniref:Single-stranded-DNA-specific exonuclease RecJ n=1 Tax=Candidatus Falkowbacteria bacterium CG10_big_fil_rev_8_21_14_0_10_39_9 TaxID=1974566 RepID=A0A2M6WQK2_9BACT|nr:MAG: single-stranded-DNA-specific exonuclease RecJ [Candidatus Falkowbacteria bacterium CG10_big_fil_rev_8_21_14_0_10_39_9]
MAKIWQLMEKMPAEVVSTNSQYSPVLLQLLFNRGIKTPAEVAAFFVEEFFSAEYLKRYDPFLFKDMAASIDLIVAHIKGGEKIMIYGDYDADGVTATAVLWDTFRILGAKVDYYLPDRVTEGYGMNKEAIDKIAADGYKLVITVDTGTRNWAEINYAQSLGLKIILTDHHSLPENPSEMPQCLFINCTNQAEAYPFKTLAGVGVALKVVQALVSRSKLTDDQKQYLVERSLDLVALGTISDMVPLLGENRLLVKKGLEVLNRTKRLGLKELISVAKIGLNGVKLDSWNIGFQLGPRLNAASRLGHANNALELILSTDQVEVTRLASELNQKNIERQEITANIMALVEKDIDPKNVPAIIISVCDLAYDTKTEGVIGLVACKICEKYYRPTLIITRSQDGYKSSGRSIEEFNLIEAIEESCEFLDKYGGHPAACGFSVYEKEKLDKFIVKISTIATAKLAGLELAPKLRLDAILSPQEIDLTLMESISQLAPYGQNNPQPKFASYDLTIMDIVTMGAGGEHIKLRLADGSRSLWAIAFFKKKEFADLTIGQKVDIAYYLDLNNFNGKSEVQMKLIDLIKK